MKILSIIGTRPQWIKLFPIHRELKRRNIQHIIVNTGQHYDYEMDGIFADQFGIGSPNYNLEVGSESPPNHIAKILEGAEPIISNEKPDLILVYGDTNSTVAGTICAVKLGVKVVHIEAGFRSFDRSMPEEINRVIVDHLANLLLAPTKKAIQNLKKEGLKGYLVGDPLAETFAEFSKTSDPAKIFSDLKLIKLTADYVLVTIHRNFNTDNKSRLSAIVLGLINSGKRIVFPLHPRTEKKLSEFDLYDKLRSSKLITLCPPVGYLDMVALELNASKILTDSGGVQREAFLANKICYVVRENTEFDELLKSGAIKLLPAEANKISEALKKSEKNPKPNRSTIVDSSKRIVDLII